MVIAAFPTVENADEHGLLAVGGDLDVDSLLLAYKSGIFPWPLTSEQLAWFAPPKRALLFIAEAHTSKSLKKFLKKCPYRISINRDFESIIRRCSEIDNRKRQSGTWISEEVVNGYIALHKAGYAHSIEVYEDSTLAGGLYGVAIGAMFAGESMFYKKTNASKVALHFLIQYLRERNVKWIDCQVMTPLLKSFGAREIERQEFMCLLEAALVEKLNLFADCL